MYCAIENACLFTPTNICVSTHVNSPNLINYKQNGLRFGYGLGTFVAFDIFW